MNGMPRGLKVYTGSVIVLGLVLFLLGGIKGQPALNLSMLFFIVIGGITESLDIRVKNNAAISISFAIGLAAIFIFQFSTVVIIGFITMLAYIEIIDKKVFYLFNTNVYKRFFNAGAYALSLGLSSVVYSIFDQEYMGMRIVGLSIPGVTFAILTYTIINTAIFTILIAILENKKFKEVFIDNKWTMTNILGLSPLGVIIAMAYNTYGWFAVILFLGPLLLARYSFKLYIDMRHIYFETIKALSNAMEAKDEYTKGHSYRVAEYAVGIAKQMHFSQDKIDKINTAAILHDIGKIGIADRILNKPGQLEEGEFLEIQRHPEIGAKILVEVDFLREVAHIIKHHHERFDGKGYPSQLSGDAIPLEACVLAVADAYDAMTSDRPYRKAMDKRSALVIIEKESGSQFHPFVVKHFVTYMNSQREQVSYAS